MALSAENALFCIEAIMGSLTINQQDWVAERLYAKYVGYLLLQDDDPDWKDQIDKRPSTTVLTPLERPNQTVDTETPLF